MPSRLVGILACLLLANVANYALSEWLEAALPVWSDVTDGPDGSTLITSQYYESVGVMNDGEPALRALLNFYRYLDEGGSAAYNSWQAALVTRGGPGLLPGASRAAAATNTVRALSLLTLAIIGCCLLGRVLREERYFTPFFYFTIGLSTTALFAGFASPLLLCVYALVFITYYGGLLLFLPIYRTECTRAMRPWLTWYILLLLTMAWRGNELVDYWFWTSQLYRLLLVFTLLLAVLFHLLMVHKALKAAKMTTITRVFAYGFPLGTTWLTLGLFLGLYGADAGAGLRTLNEQLVVLPQETVLAINPDAAFTLFFAGAMVLICSGIGYYVQRIAQ